MAGQKKTITVVLKLDTNGALKSLKAFSQKAKASLGGLDKKAKATGGAFKGMFSKIGAVAGGMLAFKVVTMLIGAVTDLYNKVVKFGQAQVDLAAIMGRTREQVKGLTKEANALGSTSKWTSYQVTEMFQAFAKAGLVESEMRNMASATLDFATAMGIQLPEAATIAITTMNGFDIATVDSAHSMGVLAKATNTSTLSYEKLNTILPYVTTSARLAGLTLEETVAAVAKLSDKGQKASKIGTGFRKVMDRLVKSGLSYSDAMKKVNESSDPAKTALKLFGTTAKDVGVIMAESQEEIDEFKESLMDVRGVMDKAAATRLDSVSGSITKLGSAWDAIMTDIEDGNGKMAGFLKATFNGIKELLEDIYWTDEEKAANERVKQNSKEVEEAIQAFKEGTKDKALAATKEEHDAKVDAYLAEEGLVEDLALAKKRADKSVADADEAARKMKELEEFGYMNAINAFGGKQARIIRDATELRVKESKSRMIALNNEFKLQKKQIDALYALKDPKQKRSSDNTENNYEASKDPRYEKDYAVQILTEKLRVTKEFHKQEQIDNADNEAMLIIIKRRAAEEEISIEEHISAAVMRESKRRLEYDKKYGKLTVKEYEQRLMLIERVSFKSSEKRRTKEKKAEKQFNDDVAVMAKKHHDKMDADNDTRFDKEAKKRLKRNQESQDEIAANQEEVDKKQFKKMESKWMRFLSWLRRMQSEDDTNTIDWDDILDTANKTMELVEAGADLYEAVSDRKMAIMWREHELKMELLNKELDETEYTYDRQSLALEYKAKRDNMTDKQYALADFRLKDGLLKKKRVLEERMAAEKAIAEKKAFEEKKKIESINVLINTASGVMNAWATAGNPYLAAALSALIIATGAYQYDTIQSQHLAEGGEIMGSLHRNGGVNLGNGVEAEGGEFVVNRAAYANNKGLINAINDTGNGSGNMAAGSGIIDYDLLASKIGGAVNSKKVVLSTNDLDAHNSNKEYVESVVTF